MPDWTKLVGGWFLAVVVALALSWGAVAQVRNRVVQPSIEIPTTAVAAAARAPVAPGETTTTAPTVIRVEPEIEGGDGTVSTLAADPSAATTTTSGSTQTTSPPNSPPSTSAPGTSSTTSPTTTSSTTTTQPPTTTTQPPATTTTTTTTEPSAETKTSSYQLVGGVVTISHSPGVVNFVTAVPQPGYSTDLREAGPDRVRVRFESESQTSDFRAEWEGSELIITKNETGGD